MRGSKSWSLLGLQHLSLPLGRPKNAGFHSLAIDNAINILLIHGELRMRCWDGGERRVGQILLVFSDLLWDYSRELRQARRTNCQG